MRGKFVLDYFTEAIEQRKQALPHPSSVWSQCRKILCNWKASRFYRSQLECRARICTFCEGHWSLLASLSRTVAASSLDSKLSKGRVHSVDVFVSLTKCFSNRGLRTSLLLEATRVLLGEEFNQEHVSAPETFSSHVQQSSSAFTDICWGAQLKESFENRFQNC